MTSEITWKELSNKTKTYLKEARASSKRVKESCERIANTLQKLS